MKFALVAGERREAEPGLSSVCEGCAAAMIAKCGTLKVWHWAHRSGGVCDHWWEPETAWHRGWKNLFPESWQESVHRADDGEKHIADVKTANGVVIEFQYSHLRLEERMAREGFYKTMVWVVSGLRRKRDKDQFAKALRESITLHQAPSIFSAFVDEAALLRDWVSSLVPVYFDFGDAHLWRLEPAASDIRANIMLVPKAEFIRTHVAGEPLDRMCSDFIASVAANRARRQQADMGALAGFNRFAAQRRWARTRRRL